MTFLLFCYEFEVCLRATDILHVQVCLPAKMQFAPPSRQMTLRGTDMLWKHLECVFCVTQSTMPWLWHHTSWFQVLCHVFPEPNQAPQSRPCLGLAAHWHILHFLQGNVCVLRGVTSEWFSWFQQKVKSRFRETCVCSVKKTKKKSLVPKNVFVPDCTKLMFRSTFF